MVPGKAFEEAQKLTAEEGGREGVLGRGEAEQRLGGGRLARSGRGCRGGRGQGGWVWAGSRECRLYPGCVGALWGERWCLYPQRAALLSGFVEDV